MTEETKELTAEEKLLNRVIEYRLLTQKDITNDYYFLQYLGTILDYVERDNTGCLTDLGRMSLAVNVAPIYQKFVDNKEKVTQKELVRFCLYMTNCYAVCVLFKGMVEVYKENNEGFLKLNENLPTYVFGDMIEYEDRAFGLVDKFKKIMDGYSQSLEGKYRTIYNEEKIKGFVKQIFATHIISSKGSFIPNELVNAKECK
jgi:hypothetical protein